MEHVLILGNKEPDAAHVAALRRVVDREGSEIVLKYTWWGRGCGQRQASDGVDRGRTC